jgi:hypothetical protein
MQAIDERKQSISALAQDIACRYSISMPLGMHELD